MKLRTFLPLFLVLAFFMSACSSFKYKSIGDFRKEKEAVRTKYIEQVLKDHELNSYNQFTLTYMNLVLNEDKYYNALFKINPEADLENFLDESIQTLYYAYTPDNYMKADKDRKKLAKDFLVNVCPYRYHYGESKFRKLLEKNFDDMINSKYVTDHIFLFYDSAEQKETAEGKRVEVYSQFINMWIWNNFTFGDFKKLYPDEQGQIIIYDRLFFAPPEDPDGLMYITNASRKWEQNSTNYLQESPFTEITDNTELHSAMHDILASIKLVQVIIK